MPDGERSSEHSDNVPGSDWFEKSLSFVLESDSLTFTIWQGSRWGSAQCCEAVTSVVRTVHTHHV